MSEVPADLSRLRRLREGFLAAKDRLLVFSGQEASQDAEAWDRSSMRLAPAELVYDEDQAVPTDVAARATSRPPWHFELDSANRLLCAQFGTKDLSGFGCDELQRGIIAAGALFRAGPWWREPHSPFADRFPAHLATPAPQT